jgi:hypothetical protein
MCGDAEGLNIPVDTGALKRSLTESGAPYQRFVLRKRAACAYDAILGSELIYSQYQIPNIRQQIPHKQVLQAMADHVCSGLSQEA